MNRLVVLAGLLVALALGTALGFAPPDGLEGFWEGSITPNPLAEVRVTLRIDRGPDGALRARAESPEMASQPPIDFDVVEVNGTPIRLASKKNARTFQGTLNPAGNELAGELKGANGGVPITFARLKGPFTRSDVWEGSLVANGGIKLRLVFHARKVDGGGTRATMDSPDQGAFGFKVDQAEVSDQAVKFVLANIGEFDGKPDAKGESAQGVWKQGGMSTALTLKKLAAPSVVNRPQTPKGPFPYRSEEVAYDSVAKGVRIAGTLTLPEGKGPFPAALLITGSGPQDRDETLLGHKPFLVLADALTRRGIAVLRVDDRGVGGSTGSQATATTADFAEDVRGGVAFLKGDARIKPGRIGLIGHSEGGLIAPIVAASSDDVAFIILLAGPGLPGDEILVAQTDLILKASGADAATTERSVANQRKFLAIAKGTVDSQAAVAQLKAAQDEMVKLLPEAERKAIQAADPSGAGIKALTTPWMRYFLTYDPRPTLAKVRCPVLAINGELDLQVPCRENLDAVEKAIRSGGNPRVTARAMPGLNHLFQPTKTGAPSEYATIEETFSPDALKLVGDWILEQAKGQ